MPLRLLSLTEKLAKIYRAESWYNSRALCVTMAMEHRVPKIETPTNGRKTAMRRIIRLAPLGFLALVLAAKPADDAEDKSIADINKLGGTIERDDKKPGAPVIAVDFSKKEVKDADLKCLQNLGELRSLKLDNSRITDDGLKFVKELKNLRRLTLSFTAISDEGLKHLTSLSHLEFLHVGYCAKVTAQGKALLRKSLPKLEIFGP
jgi:hypothetical protein